MQRAEEKLTARADRFWGVPTKNEQVRKPKCWGGWSLNFTSSISCHDGSVDEVEAGKTEDLEEMANILKLPQYAQKTYLV